MRSAWRLAAVALLLCVGCESGDEPPAARSSGSPPPASPSPVSWTSVELGVLEDFSVLPAAPDSELTTVSATSLDAGGGSVVVLAVDRPRVPGRCIVDARLHLDLDDPSGLAPTELAVYPSRVFDAADKEDGDRFGYSGALLDVRPRGIYAGASSESTVWDVTEIVKRWVSGDPFPSQATRVPERGPIVLALRDIDGAEPFARATIASSEDTGSAPYVELTGRDCVTGRA